MKKFGEMAATIGKGLVAGAVGTVAMTASSTLAMKKGGREPSPAPADAAAKVLGVTPAGERERARFATVVHWAYGTSWGAVRGLLATVGLSGPAAIGAHYGAIWGTALVMLPRLEVAPPVRDWGIEELGIDAAHHLVYALATSGAYAALERI